MGGEGGACSLFASATKITAPPGFGCQGHVKGSGSTLAPCWTSTRATMDMQQQTCRRGDVQKGWIDSPLRGVGSSDFGPYADRLSLMCLLCSTMNWTGKVLGLANRTRLREGWGSEGRRGRGEEGRLSGWCALTWRPVRSRELPGLPPMKNSDEYTSSLAGRPEVGLPGGGPKDILR